jgi:hypothetical protein
LYTRVAEGIYPYGLIICRDGFPQPSSVEFSIYRSFRKSKNILAGAFASIPAL